MLNLFNPRQDVNVPDDTPTTNSVHLSDTRKKLRWAVNNPPADLARVMDITPVMATVMLERNADEEWRNRPNSEKGVFRYTRAMQAGWKLTGEPIIFSVSGNLLNGQHRLMACIKAGVSFKSLVVFGIDDDAFKFMDIGIARTASHIFAIEDVPNAALAAASSRLLYGYMAKTTWEGRAPDVENSLLLDFYSHHQRIQDSFSTARQLHSDLRMQPRWGGFLHYICAQKHRAIADDFFAKVATGVGLTTKTSPAYALRKRLLQNAASSSDKLSDVHIGAFTIKAWNAHRHDERIGVLRWRTDQTPNETFPRAE